MASSPVKDLSREHTHQKQQSPYDGEGLSSKFLPKPSIIARAKFVTLNVTLADCSVILVGQSNIQQVSSNLYCDRDRLQSENGPKETHSDKIQSELQKGVTEKVECLVQVFNKGEVKSDSGPKEGNCTLNQYQTAKRELDCQVQPLSEKEEMEDTDQGKTSIASVELPMASIKVQGDFSGKHSEGERILKTLELCQDNGMFVQHKRLATEKIHYYEETKNADMVLILKIEQAVALSYENKPKSAKKMLISVTQSDLNGQASYGDVISARALYQYDSPEDWADLYYTYGCLWLDYMSLIADDTRKARARNATRNNARCSLEKALNFSQLDHRLRVRIKRERYAHIKLAAILLDCCSTAARIQEKTIPTSDIKQAKEHLDIVQFKLGNDIPTSTWIQLLKTRSDQFYRQGSYNLAKETVAEAFRFASLHKFDTELNTLQEMIELFKEKLLSHLVFTEELEASGSEATYSASGSNSG
ncbi:hypothetical protein AWC38_SpisGene17065 [Stylophora pistillata]|uniref:Uncharacterized protein n=1 Tax=Stylophora pistillata TaxID=50429 RepID=A0A2B4RN08_STYPI|nr:hypothetical protein AWC38_SpisGene17065 [Stylophora pistillata]